MIAYYTLLLAVAAFLLVSRYYATKGNWGFYWLSAVLLVAFSGLRYDVGVDFQSYLDIYYSYNQDGGRAQEPLYNLLMFIGALSGLGPAFTLTISSLLFVGGVALFFRRYSVNPEFSLFLFSALPFFYLGSFNQVRQYAALGLIVISSHFVIERKPVHFLFSLLGAAGFHYAALVFLPAYHLFSNRYRFWSYSFLLFAAAATVPFLMSLIGAFGLYSTTYLDVLEGTRVSMPMVLLALGSALCICLTYQLSHEGRPEIPLLINVLGLNLVLFSVAVTTDIAGLRRVTSWFAWPLLLLIPFLIKKIYPKEAQWIAAQIAFILSLVYFSSTIIGRGHDYNLIPYSVIIFT